MVYGATVHFGRKCSTVNTNTKTHTYLHFYTCEAPNVFPVAPNHHLNHCNFYSSALTVRVGAQLCNKLRDQKRLYCHVGFHI